MNGIVDVPIYTDVQKQPVVLLLISPRLLHSSPSHAPPHVSPVFPPSLPVSLPLSLNTRVHTVHAPQDAPRRVCDPFVNPVSFFFICQFTIGLALTVAWHLYKQRHILHGFQGYCYKDGNFNRTAPYDAGLYIMNSSDSTAGGSGGNESQSLIMGNTSDYSVGAMPNGCCFCCYYPFVPPGTSMSTESRASAIDIISKLGNQFCPDTYRCRCPVDLFQHDLPKT